MHYIVVYIKCNEESTLNNLQDLLPLIANLGSCLEVKLLNSSESAPQGCAVSTVSAKCEIHMMLKVTYIITSHHITSYCTN